MSDTKSTPPADTTHSGRSTDSAPAARAGWMSVEEAADILTRERNPEPETPAPRARPRASAPPPAPEPDTSPEQPDDTSQEQEASPETTQEAQAQPEATAEDTAEDDDPEIEIVGTGDKPERVRFSELRKGYLRQADYTRKTMALAEQTKAFQQHQQSVQSERTAYATMLKALQEQLQGGEKQIDWQRLEREDPHTYLIERRRADDRMTRLNAIASEQERLRATEMQEQAQRFADRQRQSTEYLLAQIPDWKRQDVAQREITELRDFANSTYGFTPEQLDQYATLDPRLVLVMRDAIRASRAQGKGPVAAKRVPPAAVRAIPRARAVPQTDQHAARRSQAQSAFDKNPTLSNAVEALLAERGVT